MSPFRRSGVARPVEGVQCHVTYRAVFKGRLIAEAPEHAVKHVEGNVYFPPDAVSREYVEPSELHTRCYWKGKASYLNVVGEDDVVAPDAAFYYPKPWPLARGLANYVAFWRGVKVERS